ncbi:MAG: PLP-dependent aminotransferase family protein [Clostridia bacterium]|nr:PLP-dependent aminotransferase family protein [Clostridia bacterium]
MKAREIKKQSKKPLYETLYEEIKKDIVSGKIRQGEKLPSKRVLAERIGVSVITVDAAYRLLIDEGYVYSKERSGFFVGGAAQERADRITPSAPTDIVAAKSADVDFRFSSFSKIMRKVITDYDRALLIKPPAFGCVELRKALSDYLYRYRGMDVGYENIIIGSGSEYFYGMIVALFGRDKIYGLEYPSYEKISAVIRTEGADYEFLKMGKDGILTKELAKSKATVLFVTPFNSYPTGITADYMKRMEYVEWARERNGYIVEDDIDSEFAVGAKPVETIYSLDGGKRVIYLNTFSKSIAPSMRMGYMILPDELLAEYKKRLGFYSCTVPAFDQYVMAEFIGGGLFERHLNRIRRKLKE